MSPSEGWKNEILWQEIPIYELLRIAVLDLQSEIETGTQAEAEIEVKDQEEMSKKEAL